MFCDEVGLVCGCPTIMFKEQAVGLVGVTRSLIPQVVYVLLEHLDVQDTMKPCGLVDTESSLSL